MPGDAPHTPTETPPGARLHSLDALRAFAMLLGIALHAALSFTTWPFPVSDTRSDPVFNAIIEVIHVFRMPVFFVMSGFFTAMLLGRRGVGGMLAHRAKRIALPLALGVATVVPATFAVFAAVSTGPTLPDTPPSPAESTDLWTAAALGDTAAIADFLDRGDPLDAPDAIFGTTPLGWAAIGGHPDAARVLLGRGADPNQRYSDDNTALHSAAFFGRIGVVELLLDAGADPAARSVRGDRPIDVIRADEGTTAFIAGIVGVDIDFDEVLAGRAVLRPMLLAAADSATDGSAGGEAANPPAHRLLRVFTEAEPLMHLWFLWHLCLFVAVLAAAGAALRAVEGVAVPRPLIATPLALAALVPLTALTQSWQSGVGPDTSTVLAVPPRILAHYAVFFFFGALVHTVPGAIDRLGRTWWAWLAVAGAAGTLMLRPSHDPDAPAWLSPTFQSVFAWASIFALTGVFRAVLSRERRWVRYLSDASYWMYLVHFPIVVVAQRIVRDIDAHAAIKFAAVLAAVTAITLVTYRFAVRYTPIGRLLNGPRTRPADGRVTSPAASA